MKKTYVFVSLLLTSLLFSGQAKGQETTQNQEIGFRTSSLSSFDIIYKKQKEENSYSRLRLATGEIDIGTLAPFNGSLSLGIAGGKENRQALSDKLFFVTGYELMCTLRTSVVVEKPSFSITPGIGVVLGFSYLASDKFLVGIETIPAASFKFGYSNNDVHVSDLNIRFASTYAALFVAYRFSK